MTARRPLILFVGSPNELRELADGDASIAELLADRNGVVFCTVDTVASQVNGLGITPGAAGTSPRFKAVGSDTNLDLLLASKGTGKVKVGPSGSEVEAVDLSTAQTLTTKDMRDSSNQFPFTGPNGSVRQFVRNPSTSTLENVGFTAAPTLTGTAASGDQSARPYLKLSTAASTDSDAIMESPTVDCARGLWFPRLILPVRFSSVSNVRLWAGFADASLSAVDTPTTQKVVAVRFSTSASDTNLKLVTCSGSASTVTDLGIAGAANTDYLLDIERRTSDWRVRVNGTTVATVTATLPAQASFMGFRASLRTLAAAAVDLYVGSCALAMK